MRPSGRAAAGTLTLALVAGLGAVGCGKSEQNESLLGEPSRSGAVSPSANSSGEPLSRIRTRSQALGALGDAVRRGDRSAYLGLIDAGSRLRAKQERTFDNLRRLPLASLTFSSDGDRVLRSMRLREVDSRAMVAPTGLRLVRRAGQWRLQAGDQAATEPWDLVPISVRRSGGVLLVGDAGSDTKRLAALAGRAHRDVRRILPSGVAEPSALMLAFRSARVRAGYTRVDGSDSEHLGAVTFPTRAGYRIGLLPTALDAQERELGRLLRHELAHVAIGTRARGAPTWLSEGLAEHLAAQAGPSRDRRIATPAVRRARAGGITLPDDAGFYRDPDGLHYAVAWMAVAALSAEHGESAPWKLLAALRGTGRDRAARDVVLRQRTGLDTAGLADRARRRILRLYG